MTDQQNPPPAQAPDRLAPRRRGPFVQCVLAKNSSGRKDTLLPLADILRVRPDKDATVRVTYRETDPKGYDGGVYHGSFIQWCAAAGGDR